ncbi:hypothetical protein NBRC116592_15210 [Colwellia sp. KU-HH00111]|uniref:hypothetical protein n=1 Tax=Colwellia sp. KU-HH00111 TaxID=3127652 RepID=UPI003101D0C6
MTSWREPDYRIEIEQSNLKEVLSGYAIDIKIHRASKPYPLSGMIITNIGCLWLNSQKSKVNIGEPVSIELLACCDSMNIIESEEDPLAKYIGLHLKGIIMHPFKITEKKALKNSRLLRRLSL